MAFDAAVSLFDVFDLNMDSGYRQRWNGSFGLAADDHALIARSSYDAAERLARMDLTMFRLVEGTWSRIDVSLLQRAYPEDEAREALTQAGFREVTAFDAALDLQLPGGQGRTFFVAVKPFVAEVALARRCWRSGSTTAASERVGTRL